jgi:hypothetical protein
MDDRRLDAALDAAFAHLERAGGDPRALEEPFRTAVIVCAAQGVIDNGGLHYFFAADFPHHPPYATFVAAYRAIGADAAAAALERAAALFPFASPERDIAARNAFMNTFCRDDGRTRPDSPFVQLDVLCGDNQVWQRLSSFVESHALAFGLPVVG